MRDDRAYDPELNFRASEKQEGNYYVYIDDYVLNQLKNMAARAEEAMIAAKNADPTAERHSVGPINFFVLNEEDRDFYATKRKFKRVPDASLKLRLPKELKTQSEAETF